MRHIRPTTARIALALLAIAAGSGAALAHPPYELVVDPAGNAYFSDLEAVWRLAPDGRLGLFRPGVEGTHVHELAIAGGAVEGDLNSYDGATQTYSGGIWRRGPDGRETWVLAPTSAAPKGIGVRQDPAGNRYVAQWVSNDDRRTMLFRRAPDGRVDLLFGPADAAAKFREVITSSVGGMVFPPDGAVVFADGRVLRRAAGGTVTTVFSGPADSSLRGLALARDGRLLAADFGRRAVYAISAAGDAQRVYGSSKGWAPTSAAERSGRLLVLEANLDPHDYVNRVRVVEVANGRGRVVAAPGDPGAAPGAASGPSPVAAERPASTGTLAAMAAVLLAAAAGGGLLLRRLRDRRKTAG